MVKSVSDSVSKNRNQKNGAGSHLCNHCLRQESETKSLLPAHGNMCTHTTSPFRMATATCVTNNFPVFPAGYVHQQASGDRPTL